MRYALILMSLAALAGCAGKTAFRDACAGELSAAWAELDVAKAEGFTGTVSYSKALGLLGMAKSMQTVENFDNCVNHAKDARYYIAQSRKGQ